MARDDFWEHVEEAQQLHHQRDQRFEGADAAHSAGEHQRQVIAARELGIIFRVEDRPLARAEVNIKRQRCRLSRGHGQIGCLE